jgi:hypothetical protein
MAGNGGGEGRAVGKVTCAAWVRRRGDDGPPGVSRLLVVFGRGATASSPPLLELLEFDARASALASEPLVTPRLSGAKSDRAMGSCLCALACGFAGEGRRGRGDSQHAEGDRRAPRRPGVGLRHRQRVQVSLS